MGPAVCLLLEQRLALRAARVFGTRSGASPAQSRAAAAGAGAGEGGSRAGRWAPREPSSTTKQYLSGAVAGPRQEEE